jgi:hypothetical protein
MNTLPKCIITIIMMLIFLSCSTKFKEQNNDFQRYENFLKSNNIFNKNEIQKSKIILFIPVDGCEDCVSKCTVFIKNNKKIPCYIMSSNKKESNKYRIKNNITGLNKNIVFDEKAISLKSGIYSAFPYIMHFDKDLKIDNIVVLNALNIEKELTQLGRTSDDL